MCTSITSVYRCITGDTHAGAEDHNATPVVSQIYKANKENPVPLLNKVPNINFERKLNQALLDAVPSCHSLKLNKKEKLKHKYVVGMKTECRYS